MRILPSLLLAVPLGAADFLPVAAVPGSRLSVIDGPHLTVVMPRAQVESLRPLAAWADAAYARMSADAGYRPRRLTLLLGDASDDHNGFSMVAPVLLVQIDLAPAAPVSGIFAGEDHLQRTIVHELAHHIGNDQNHGFRGALDRIFGRVYPDDLLSLLTAYLATPSHATMPFFWHEGTAQWAETAYADPDSVWGGRGRDSLTHMVWRLDAAGGGVPPSNDWRHGFPAWPWGNRTYLYGLAYARWLEARYGRSAGIWRLVEAQGRQWAFSWASGSEGLLGRSHDQLIDEARRDLAAEQQAALARLTTRSPTILRRLTRPDSLVGSPAWLPDGRILAAYDDRYGEQGAMRFSADGGREASDLPGRGRDHLRTLPDGTAVVASLEFEHGLLSDEADSGWLRSRLTVAGKDGRSHTLDGRRLIQPDLRRHPGPWPASSLPVDDLQVAAVRLLPAGRQELVLCPVRLGAGLWTSLGGGRQGDWQAIATQGRPWSPAFRPGHEELAWVETDRAGSRLVLAPLADPTRRTVLAQVRGRIIHPAWSADGARLFFCADQSGVANAWTVAADRPGELLAVTHTLGGVVACVPSPDGRELALVDHDRHGPFLARIPADPATWPGTVPELPLAWPAPVEARGALPGSAPVPPPEPLADAGTDDGLPPASTYSGLLRLRPLFWTPTTEVAPGGGYGVMAVAGDPLLTNQLVAGIGAGPEQGSLVWSAGYVNAAWRLEFGLLGWGEERTWEELAVDAVGLTHDYTEQVTVGEARLGTGLAGGGFRPRLWLAGGLANRRATDETRELLDGLTIISAQPFTGRENYLEAVAAWSGGSRFPTSYTREDGSKVALSYRHSGLSGDLHGKRLLAVASYVASVWPRGGHQAYAGGAVGWSRGLEDDLQRPFQVGGSSGLDLPRGYPTVQAVGDHLFAWTAGYRFPIWRPFAAVDNSSFGLRQLVLEGYFDAALVSGDRPRGDGEWFRSAGGEIKADCEVWALRLAPGFGLAHRIDGPQGESGYFTLGFRW